MPVERTPEQDETSWLFYRCLSTPSVFFDWTRHHIEGEGFRAWKKQIIEMNREAKKKKRVQARFLGKTVTVASEFAQHCVLWTKPTGVALFATRQESNLEPVFNRELVGAFQRIPFLRLFLQDGDAGINRKQWTIALRNGVIIRGRIEGKEGAGFQTIHPDVCAWWDEVQLLSDEAVGEAYGMISDELDRFASGVPNGVRTSWAFKIDTDPSYGFEGGKMTRHDDPRYTKEMDDELAEFYGGRQSSGYLNRVMGEWGASSRQTFDLDRIVRDLPVKPDSTSTVKPSFYRSLDLHATDVANADGTPRLDVLEFRFAFRGDMPRTDKIWFHADHGQSATPTTLYITFWDLNEKCWRSYHRVLLYGMEAPTQAEIIHWLAQQIKRMTSVEPVIGFDTTGHGGSAVMALLQQHGHALVRVDVREAVDTHEKRLETEEEARKRFAKDPFSPPEKQLVPIYQVMRQIAFPRLAREFYAERLRLVNESALVKQLAGATDYEDKSGNKRIYETDYSEDGVLYNHDMSAFEVLGAMLHELDIDQTVAPPQAWAIPVNIGWGVMDAG